MRCSASTPTPIRVHLPEFPTQKYHTYGDTYEEAVKNAQEVIEMLIAEYQEDGKTLPLAKSLEQLIDVAENRKLRFYIRVKHNALPLQNLITTLFRNQNRNYD
ncbi:type II toxin-antitoxin system HicB family antitoxin [Dolichospermum compactum]|uniref:HicB-like antitoxin of toxin-antitoxin system domain-containing protein n=1 Tax=Dolichospermum compactum NIES-806 TaxID=1973481 RepID=A0A1Z4V1S3_9CYAN|nr:hypothetical protein NIES806_16410 [Dolichospermum compactum NIES-806]